MKALKDTLDPQYVLFTCLLLFSITDTMLPSWLLNPGKVFDE